MRGFPFTESILPSPDSLLWYRGVGGGYAGIVAVCLADRLVCFSMAIGFLMAASVHALRRPNPVAGTTVF